MKKVKDFNGGYVEFADDVKLILGTWVRNIEDEEYLLVCTDVCYCDCNSCLRCNEFYAKHWELVLQDKAARGY